MTLQLRDELARIGDDAPRVDLPDDLWARGRRVRTRGRALVAGAAACLVLAALGLSTAVVGRVPALPEPVAPAPAPGEPGLPDVLYALPSHLAAGTAREGVTMPDQAAAALVAQNGTVVLVDAGDGGYHLLDLPGFGTGDPPAAWVVSPSSSSPVALSPDGRRLAYAYADFPGSGATTRPDETGIAVVDLASGSVERQALSRTRSELRVEVRSVVWSPEGRWVGWSGTSLREWALWGTGVASEDVLGRWAPGSDEASRPIEPATGNLTVAMADDGALVEVNGSGLVRVHRVTGPPTDFRVARRGLAESPVGAITADGTRVALAAKGTEGPYLVIDLAAQRLEDEEPPLATIRDEVVRPAGWLDDDTVTLVEDDNRSEDGRGPEIKVVSTPTTSHEEFRDRRISYTEPNGEQEGGTVYVSVATDLITDVRLSVHRAEPDFPWSPVRRLTVAATSVVVLLLGAVLLWRRRLPPLP